MLAMLVRRELGLRIIASTIRVICGVRPIGRKSYPFGPKVFYANHTSHMDFTLIWSVLPNKQRLVTRPVAARDYWVRNRVTRFVGSDVFNALLIERKHITRENNPMNQMVAVLKKGRSLIVFPEGTRHEAKVPQNFKPGLFHLSEACPDVPLIPVYLENLNRMLPKGTFLPIPLISRIILGKPLPFNAVDMERAEFLERAREALVQLSK